MLHALKQYGCTLFEQACVSLCMYGVCDLSVYLPLAHCKRTCEWRSVALQKKASQQFSILGSLGKTKRNSIVWQWYSVWCSRYWRQILCSHLIYCMAQRSAHMCALFIQQYAQKLCPPCRRLQTYRSWCSESMSFNSIKWSVARASAAWWIRKVIRAWVILRFLAKRWCGKLTAL